MTEVLARVEQRAGVLRRRRRAAAAGVLPVAAAVLALVVWLQPAGLLPSHVKVVHPAGPVAGDADPAAAGPAASVPARARPANAPAPRSWRSPSTTTPTVKSPAYGEIPTVSRGPTGMVAYLVLGDIWVSNVDGAGRRRLTSSNDGDPAFYSVDWSPDGQHILGEMGSTSATESGFQLAVVDLQGHVRHLTHATSNGGSNPRWSPDGRHIAYEAPPPTTPANAPLVSGHGSGVWIVDADGSNARMLTYGAEPSWTPDGQSVVYFCPGNGAAATCFASLDGTVTKRLPEGPLFPMVSPDGRQIAGLGAGNHVVVFNIDGSGLRLLPNPSDDQIAGPPAWSPDGRWIAVIERHSSKTCTNGVCQAGPYQPYLSVQAADGSGAALTVQGPDIWVSFAPPPA